MRLMIATGGPPYAAVRLGAEIARRAGKAPTVLTVIGDEGARPQADSILACACELLEPQVSGVRTRVRVGHPAEEILPQIGLFVKGSHLSIRKGFIKS